MGGNPYGREDAPWDAVTLSRFEQDAGKGVSIIEFGQSWTRCRDGDCGYQAFDGGAMNLIRSHGSIPLLNWTSWLPSNGPNQARFELGAIIAGAHDAFLRSWAAAAKAWGRPLFLRFDPEMNLGGAHFPWQENTNGNEQGEYVQMWRHVHDIFTSVGATNVTWVWCPNIEYAGSTKPLSRFFPGAAYVDWTCMDGYNWGTNPNGARAGWRSFEEIFRPTYDLITHEISSKPMLIGEVAATEYGGSKADWIHTTLASVPTQFPRIKALVWFNKIERGMDWPIESSASAQNAFKTGVAGSSFLSNSFATLTASPIPAPA